MNVILAGTVFAVALSTGVLVCLPQAVRSRFKLTKEFDNRSKGAKKSLEESEGDTGVV